MSSRAIPPPLLPQALAETAGVRGGSLPHKATRCLGVGTREARPRTKRSADTHPFHAPAPAPPARHPRARTRRADTGMGNTAAGVEVVKKWMEEGLGIYVYSVEIGGSTEEDFASTYVGNVGEQVDFVCRQIRERPELAGGFNGIGFSQGSQFMRGVLERCQHKGPKMARLITLGGQHQGVMARKPPLQAPSLPVTSHLHPPSPTSVSARLTLGVSAAAAGQRGHWSGVGRVSRRDC